MLDGVSPENDTLQEIHLFNNSLASTWQELSLVSIRDLCRYLYQKKVPLFRNSTRFSTETTKSKHGVGRRDPNSYHSKHLLLDPVDVVISDIYQVLYLMYIKSVILYNLSSFIYLKK